MGSLPLDNVSPDTSTFGEKKRVCRRSVFAADVRHGTESAPSLPTRLCAWPRSRCKVIHLITPRSRDRAFPTARATMNAPPTEYATLVAESFFQATSIWSELEMTDRPESDTSASAGRWSCEERQLVLCDAGTACGRPILPCHGVSNTI